MPETAISTPDGLWNGETIEIIGLTGEVESGKTLFGLQIDPENTLVMDVEKSSSLYERHLPFMRVDVIDHMNAIGQKYQPIDLFLEFMKLIREKTADAAYSVIMVDPISEIEAGLVQYVTENPEEFGFTRKQLAKASGLIWGPVKALWKKILSDMATRCETLVYTSHLKVEWKGDRPTRNKIPKGKDTLLELATLYLWLDRPKDRNGVKPDVPSATVLKSRLATMKQTTDGMKVVPMLPPFMKRCTPDVIREYILNPPDYKKLKASERQAEVALTDDDRLLIQAEIADNQRAAAEANAEASHPSRSSSSPFLSGNSDSGSSETTPTSNDKTDDDDRDDASPPDPLSPEGLEQAMEENVPHEDDTGFDERAEVDGDRITPEQCTEMKRLIDELNFADSAVQASIEKRGVERMIELNQEQAADMIANLKKIMADREGESLFPTS